MTSSTNLSSGQGETESPGASPQAEKESRTSNITSDSAQDSEAVTNSPYQARDTAYTAAQTAGGLFASAGLAARQYLPTSIVGTLGGPETTSLPSPEANLNSEPTTDSGCSLSNTLPDMDVAKLPEEHALKCEKDNPVEEEGPPETTASEGENNNVYSTEPMLKPTGGPGTAGATTAQQFLNSYLQPVPSPHHHGTDLHHFKGPDSQAAQHPLGPSTPPDEMQTDSSKVSGKYGNRNKPLPPPGGNTNKLPDDGEGENDTSYVRDQEKRQPARTYPNHAYTPPGSGADLDTIGETHEEEVADDRDAESISSSSIHEKRAKSSLKQKIKGEAKVFAGKIMKDPKKVETGKAMKNGHAWD